tara:strand:- start:129 stop:371 length:243 start_codon:yes stop_codon:yes gene_type:complete
MSNLNRVWIQLEKGTEQQMAKRVELANKLLHRMYGDLWLEIPFPRFQSTGGDYILILDASQMYLDLTDDGHWFDLDFFDK